VKLRIDAILGAISEAPKMIAAIIVITMYFAEIPVPFGLKIIARTPIIKKRYAIPDSNRLIQVATVKTWGVANTVAAVPVVGDTPLVNSTKVCLRVLVNDISSELDPIEYHKKVIKKRSNTVAVLIVSSNLGFTLEMMKTKATIAR